MAKQSRSAVYTGGPQANKFQCKSYWKKASDGCSEITGFFSVSHTSIKHNWAYWQQKQPKAQSADLQMMSDDETYNTENEDLKADPVNGFMIEMGVDILYFCLKHLETAESGNEIGDGLDVDKFLVSNQLIYYFW